MENKKIVFEIDKVTSASLQEIADYYNVTRQTMKKEINLLFSKNPDLKPNGYVYYAKQIKLIVDNFGLIG